MSVRRCQICGKRLKKRQRIACSRHCSVLIARRLVKNPGRRKNPVFHRCARFPACNQTWYGGPSRYKHCSHRCGTIAAHERMWGPSKRCLNCGIKIGSAKPWRKTCSRKCHFEWKHPLCAWCGKNRVKRSPARFCGRDCMAGAVSYRFSVSKKFLASPIPRRQKLMVLIKARRLGVTKEIIQEELADWYASLHVRQLLRDIEALKKLGAVRIEVEENEARYHAV